jgi:hypothetical protein
MAEASTTRTFRTEFPDFDPATLPEIPATWADRSWRNDACPSFQTPNGLAVFVDYADPAWREMPGLPRFSVQPAEADHNEELFPSDDWAAVLAFVDGYTA